MAFILTETWSFFMITLFGSGQQTISLDSSLETKGSQKQTLQLKLDIYEIAAYHSIKAPVCQWVSKSVCLDVP